MSSALRRLGFRAAPLLRRSFVRRNGASSVDDALRAALSRSEAPSSAPHARSREQMAESITEKESANAEWGEKIEVAKTDQVTALPRRGGRKEYADR